MRISITPHVPPGAARRDRSRARRPRRAAGGPGELRGDQRPHDELDGRPVGGARVGARRLSRRSTATRRVERLWEQLVYVLRLDEPDPLAAWRERLERAARRRASHRRASASTRCASKGPGTDLTVGLLPTSRFSSETPGMQTVDGVVHAPNLPTEEIVTTPDPPRVDGVVTRDEAARRRRARVVTGLRVRFEGGRAVADRRRPTPSALRARTAVDDGASRLGEVALVDGAGRIGKTEHGLLQHAAGRERGQPPRASATPTRSPSARRIATASTRARSTSTS